MKNAPVVTTAGDIVGGVRQEQAVRAQTTTIADYIALTKPRLNFLVVATSAAGLLPRRSRVAGSASDDVRSRRHGARRRRRGVLEPGA